MPADSQLSLGIAIGVLCVIAVIILFRQPPKFP